MYKVALLFFVLFFLLYNFKGILFFHFQFLLLYLPLHFGGYISLTALVTSYFTESDK